MRDAVRAGMPGICTSCGEECALAYTEQKPKTKEKKKSAPAAFGLSSKCECKRPLSGLKEGDVLESYECRAFVPDRSLKAPRV